ncbi:MAG: DUF167 domain-containing protein [Patescibacteria group bacterium]|jgi:hypothetical protein
MILTVKISPRSSRNEIKKNLDGSLKIYLTSAPVDNKANEALIKMLAEYFEVGKTKIKIVRGRTSKNKTIEILI